MNRGEGGKEEAEIAKKGEENVVKPGYYKSGWNSAKMSWDYTTAQKEEIARKRDSQEGETIWN